MIMNATLLFSFLFCYRCLDAFKDDVCSVLEGRSIKGQKISKENCIVHNSSKINQQKFLVSALASQKWNKKIETFDDVKNISL